VKKIIELTLQELYNKPKITPSIEEAIRAKEDFTFIQPEYCTKVCRLKCKSFASVHLNQGVVDVLVIQDHRAFNDGYKDGDKLERTYRGIIDELCSRNLRDLTFRVTSALKCTLERDDLTKGNKPPTVTTQSKCHPYVRQEILLAKPKVIISLGSNATKALGIKGKSNFTNRGEIIGNIVLTLHPKVTTMIRQNKSGKMWGPDFWKVIDHDFAKAGRIARGELIVPSIQEGLAEQKKHLFITRSMDDVIAATEELLRLPETKLLSYDIETTSLDPYSSDARILCVQFGYRIRPGVIRAIVIPLWHRANNGYDPTEAWKWIIPILKGKNPKIGHNVKFDIVFTYVATGVRISNVISDTMLMLHNFNSGVQGTYGLKIAVWDHLADLGIGGYEDALPKLTRRKEETEEEAEEENE
jgi:hypothetical protein